MNWISVKKRLPPLLTEVLVLHEDLPRYNHLVYKSNMQVGFMYETPCGVYWNIVATPTHWMLLPPEPAEPQEATTDIGPELKKQIAKRLSYKMRDIPTPTPLPLTRVKRFNKKDGNE